MRGRGKQEKNQPSKLGGFFLVNFVIFDLDPQTFAQAVDYSF